MTGDLTMQTETIAINGTELATKEYQGERVVTLRDINNAHSRPSSLKGTKQKKHLTFAIA